MRESKPSELLTIATDLELELGLMQRLEQSILMVQQEIQRDPERADLFYEDVLKVLLVVANRTDPPQSPLKRGT